MCSRYELNSTAREVMTRFLLRVPLPLPNRAEVRPTDAALVIVPGRGGELMRWGLATEWDKRPLINARAETLESRPTFRALLGRRVLVPASAWWEWRKQGKERIKTLIHPATNASGQGELFAFAGLADGEGRFTIVTRPACPALADIHDRMPAVLSPEAEAAWLDPETPFSVVAEALAAPPGELVTQIDDAAPPPQPSLFG